MSRLQTYLNEDVLSIDEIYEKLRKDCSPILRDLRKSNFAYLLYRASYINYGTMKKVTPRVNRLPKDTPLKLHNVLDETFRKRFGWNVRSEGVFAASKGFNNFNEYGNMYFFFPIGSYKFVWSPEIRDLYEMFDYRMLSYFKSEHERKEIYWQEYWKHTQMIDADIEFEDYVEQHKDKIDKAMNIILEDFVKTYRDKDLTSALKSGHEITFKCNKYYMVWPNDELEERLKKT